MDKPDKYAFTKELHGEDFYNKLHEIDNRLEELAKEYVEKDDTFNIHKYWMYDLPHGGKPTFFTTSQCTDETLKEKIMQIFRDVLI